MNKITIIVIIKFTYFISSSEGFGLPGEKTWSYEIKSVTSKSSDPTKLNFDIQVERVSRGIYALTGKFNMNLDIVEGDANVLLAKSYRSSNGDGVYVSLPFQMPPTHWHRYMSTTYKDTIMESIKECSDLPVFEGAFVPPLVKKVYTLTKCQILQDGFPNHLQEGFYKIVLSGRGNVEWEIELIAEVISNL